MGGASKNNTYVFVITCTISWITLYLFFLFVFGSILTGLRVIIIGFVPSIAIWRNQEQSVEGSMQTYGDRNKQEAGKDCILEGRHLCYLSASTC